MNASFDPLRNYLYSKSMIGLDEFFMRLNTALEAKGITWREIKTFQTYDEV